tara:strand:- start:820 stop:2724 length:1905 start_codon:yes stop_codon:yes gene_type:complete
MATGKTIDQLVIEIKADTRQLQKDLDSIKGRLATTGAAGGAAFGSMAGSLSKVKVGALAAVAGIATLGATISRMANTFMMFEDLKDSLDTVFGSIKAGDDALDRILDFSQKTPFQVETVTQAFIALKSAGIEPTNDMLSTFADTASTSTDQLGVFNALIRTVQRSAGGGLGLEELNMIADRGIDVFGGLKEELGLSRMELGDFGATAEGADLIVQALIASLQRKFGGAMESKMDNLSTKASNMQIAFKLLTNELMEGGLAESLKELSDTMAGLATRFAQFLATSRGEGIGIVLTGDTEKDLDLVADEIVRLEERITDLQSQPLSMRQGGEQARAREKKIQALISLLRNLRDAQSELVDEFLVSFDTEKKLNEAEKQSILVKGQLAKAFGILEKHIIQSKGDTEILGIAQDNLGAIFEKNKERLEELGILSEKDLGEAFSKLAEESQKLATELDGELKQAIIASSNAFSTDLVNSLLQGESALESFKNFARNIVAQILSIFLQLKVINPILNQIFNAGLPVGGGGSGGSSSGGITLGKAGGGTLQRGMPTIVGERGAEIFIPNTSGRIMNNMNSKNAMGGNSIVINQSVNFATGIVPTVRAEVMSMLPQIADVTKASVSEAAARGGQFRRVLQGG